MPDFPDISLPDWELCSQIRIKKQIITPAESGKAQSRPRHTSPKWRFTVGWNGLPLTEYDTLRNFFDIYTGYYFNWPHFLTGSIYVVRFLQDEFPKSDCVAFRYWKVTGLELGEV